MDRCRVENDQHEEREKESRKKYLSAESHGPLLTAGQLQFDVTKYVLGC